MEERTEVEKQSSVKVLFVEDSRPSKQTFQTLFDLEGIDVKFVGSPEEVEEILKEEQFTVIATDGLGGAWKQVVEIARARELPLHVILITNTPEIEPVEADNSRVPIFVKENFNPIKDYFMNLKESQASN